MALVAARIIPFRVKEIGGFSPCCVPGVPVDETAAQRQQVNGCTRNHGVRTHPKE